MKNPSIAILFALTAACAGENPDFFDDSPDAGSELGTVVQGMSTKFSPLYTHGMSAASTAKKAMVSLGCGGGQTCLLPGKGLVRFKVTGTDPREGQCIYSWKCQARRALNDSFPISVQALWGYGWPFGIPVEEDTANTWVEITNGNCPTSTSTNNIVALACIEWTLGNSPLVTESLTGSYRRFSGTGKMKIIFDNEAITQVYQDRPVGGSPNDDLHEIIEHATHAIIPSVYGSGIYLNDQNNGSNAWDTWSSPSIFKSTYRFEHQSYSQSEACSAGNWSSTAVSEFTQASGSCPNPVPTSAN